MKQAITHALKNIGRAAMRRVLPVAADERRIEPISRAFGLDRGEAIDRHYIGAFVDANAQRIRGAALEVGEDRYTSPYRRQLDSIDIFHVQAGAHRATLIGDLARPETLPHEAFDCFICTQTYMFIYDVAAAIRGSAHMLKPGGTLIATVAGIAQISPYDRDHFGDYWRFTTQSVERLMEQAFDRSEIRVQAYGNVYAAKAFLDGLSLEDIGDLSPLDRHDPDYPMIIGACARKGSAG